MGVGTPAAHLRRLERRLADGALPFQILLALGDGPSYGYALLERLRTQGDLTPSVGPSVIYPALARLRGAGLVTGFHGVESLGPVRKYYALTPEGRRLLPEARAAVARAGRPLAPPAPPPQPRSRFGGHATSG